MNVWLVNNVKPTRDDDIKIACEELNGSIYPRVVYNNRIEYS